MEKAGKQVKDLQLSVYYDAYGSMLTRKQSEVFDLYYNEDLSLSEIAALSKTSRQAISDTLARARRRLRQFEDSLGLVTDRVGEVDGV